MVGGLMLNSANLHAKVPLATKDGALLAISVWVNMRHCEALHYFIYKYRPFSITSSKQISVSFL